MVQLVGEILWQRSTGLVHVWTFGTAEPMSRRFIPFAAKTVDMSHYRLRSKCFLQPVLREVPNLTLLLKRVSDCGTAPSSDSWDPLRTRKVQFYLCEGRETRCFLRNPHSWLSSKSVGFFSRFRFKMHDFSMESIANEPVTNFKLSLFMHNPFCHLRKFCTWSSWKEQTRNKRI